MMGLIFTSIAATDGAVPYGIIGGFCFSYSKSVKCAG